MVRVGGCFLQNCIRGNHLARNEILADAEVLKRALGLGAPEPIGRDFDFAERVFLYSNVYIIQNVFSFLANLKLLCLFPYEEKRTDPSTCDTDCDSDHGVDYTQQRLL